jgi:hypothetical protein
LADSPLKIDLSQMFGSVSNIKLRGGVVGKVCTVLIVVAPAIAAIAWAVREVWVSVLGLVLLSGMCFALLWRLIGFAERHPQAALLEGAEFLAHEQMQLGMKSSPVLPDSAALPSQPAPRPLIPPDDPKLAALPDSQLPTDPSNG